MSIRNSGRIFGAVVLGMGIALGSVAGAAAQETMELKYANAGAAQDWHVAAMDVFREELEKRLPGRFDVKIFPNGTLYTQGTEMDAMQRGNLEIAHFNMQDLSRINNEFTIFTTPYLFRDVEHMQKVMDGEIGDWLVEQVRQDAEVQLLTIELLGTRQVGLRFEKEVNVPADLAGVKMRMVNTPEWLFMGEALGATALPMAFSEVYLAMQQGTIDAQEAQPSTVRAAKLDEVVKQMVMTNHLVQPLALAMPVELFDSLTPEEQTAIREAAAVSGAYSTESRIKDEEESVEAFRAAGMKITTPDLDAFREHVLNTYLASEYVDLWPEGMYDRIMAVE